MLKRSGHDLLNPGELLKEVVCAAMGATLTAVVLLAPSMARSQAGFPAKPIRLVVPYTTGGAPDILARMFAQELATPLGSVVVENRGGAGGNVGADVVAKSAPDGYSLLLTTTATHSINPALYASMPYDSLKDFSPITLVAYTPILLVVANNLPVHSVADLLALAKSKPGELSFASAGPGTMQHIAAELLKASTGIQMLHVPYKGTGQLVPDLVSGRVSIMFNSFPALLPLVKDGKVRAIGVASLSRNPAAPDVPTIAEAGVPGFEASAWYAVYGPANVPREIVQRLNEEFNRAGKLPVMRDRYAKLGLDPAGSSPEELGVLTRRDLEKWTRIIKANNIKAE